MQRTNIFEMHRYTSELKGRFHEMPVGDPMSGAPYGEYLKSKGLGMIVGVVAAVVTMGAAVPLLATEVLATQIMGGVMMAGGVMSGVGAVTGNKKLMKIGGILSLAGGIGGLASNALNGAGVGGAFASGSGSEAVSNMANSFMDSASSVTGGLVYGDRAAGAAAEGVAAEGATTNPVTDAQAQVTELPLDSAGSTIDPANISNGPPGTVDATTGGIKLDTGNAAVDQSMQLGAKGPTGVPLDQAPSGTGVGETNIQLSQTPTSTTASGIDPANINNGPNPGFGKGGVGGPPATTESPGILSRFNSFIGDNKEVLKVGASALETGMKYGMSGGASAAAEEAALAQANANNANAALTNTKNEEAQLKLDRLKNPYRSIMLSESDPQLEAKVAEAKANGIAVTIIPTFGKGGIKQNPNSSFGNAARMANSQTASGQQVTRQLAPVTPETGVINRSLA